MSYLSTISKAAIISFKEEKRLQAAFDTLRVALPSEDYLLAIRSENGFAFFGEEAQMVAHYLPDEVQSFDITEKRLGVPLQLAPKVFHVLNVHRYHVAQAGVEHYASGYKIKRIADWLKLSSAFDYKPKTF